MSQVENRADGNTTEHDWLGRTVRGRDGARLGRLTGVHGDWGVVRPVLGRGRLVPLDGAVPGDGRDMTVPIDRATLRTAPPAAAESDEATRTALADHYTGRRGLTDAKDRQHERYGGTKFGAAFFGWIVAIGVTVLLAALVGTVAAMFGATAPGAFWTAVVAVAVLAVAYFAGGYIAGRLARFDGPRNGLFTWVIGVVVTILAAIAAATGGARLDLLSSLQLPAVPVAPAQLTVGGVLTFTAIVVGTLLAALLGGSAGERYHHKVDRAGVRGL